MTNSDSKPARTPKRRCIRQRRGAPAVNMSMKTIRWGRSSCRSSSGLKCGRRNRPMISAAAKQRQDEIGTRPDSREVAAVPCICQVASDQERQRRKDRKDIGDQLRARCREKEEHQPGPEHEKEGVPVFMTFAPRGETVLDRLDQECAPGEQTSEHDGDERTRPACSGRAPWSDSAGSARE